MRQINPVRNQNNPCILFIPLLKLYPVFNISAYAAAITKGPSFKNIMAVLHYKKTLHIATVYRILTRCI